MKQLFDETYEAEGQTSRNLWYSEVALTQTSDFGPVINLSNQVQDEIITKIKETLAEKTATENNFYFYDVQTNQDALEEQIRMSLMIREKSGEFVVRFNMTDHNFAINLDTTLDSENQLTKKLTDK